MTVVPTTVEEVVKSGLCTGCGLCASMQPFSVLVAIGVAVVVTPLMAILTRGRYYLRRRSDGIPTPLLDADGNPSGERLRCHVTGYLFERPDMLVSAERGPDGEIQYISSLALTLDGSGRYVLPPEPMTDSRKEET